MKILLVDDSTDTRYTLRIALKALGVEVATAHSAEAAVEWLATRIPDAILMDHIMPGLNGLEALEIIRADPRTAHIPIVLCTIREDSAFAASALNKGALAVLTKPLAAERLPGVIEQLAAAIRGAEQQSIAVRPDGLTADAQPPPVSGRADGDQWMIERIDQRIDERLAAALDKRLTLAIEHLRHDLSELLSAEIHQLLDARRAEAAAAAPPPATLADLQAVETRLIEERIPDLIDRRIAEAAGALESMLLGELAAAQASSALDQSASLAPSEGRRESPTGGVPRTPPMTGAAAVADHLLSASSAALESLRAALQRLLR